MARQVVATIDLAALTHNFNRVKTLAPQSKVLAMVKANAYGHGVLTVAKHLSSLSIDALGVASVIEAKHLRAHGISEPIVVLSGALTQQELQQAIILGLDLVIHQPWQVEQLAQSVLSRPLRIWLKVDTGMHRLGFSIEQVHHYYQQLQNLKNITDIILMTHCATADAADEFFATQLTTFKSLNISQCAMSFANSAGIITQSPNVMDWVRPGIMLYGSSPLLNKTAEQLQLKPVMRLTAPVIAINTIKKGESVGYGRRWFAQRNSVIAVVSIGYGDGYPRHAKDGTPAMIKNHQVRLSGRVSMDLSCFDITDYADQIAIGDTMELWGRQNSIDVVAEYSDTISYELMCQLTNRVKFQFH